MNRENIQKVRDHIAGLPADKLNMRYFDWETECGTSACIAGWATKLLAPNARPGFSVGQAVLGLDDDTANALFYCGDPDEDTVEYARWGASPADAVQVLDHLLATGEVDWSIIDNPTPHPEGNL